MLLPVAEFPAPTPEALYDGARAVDWSAHLGADGTLAVDCTSSRSAITHTQFAALKVKDAIVDRFRDETGTRPSIDVAAPDVQVNLHIDRDVATLAIDLSGESLHRRGYRGPQGAAPLKENLAAAILLRAGWPALVAAAAADGEPLGFVDPMCGSGTLVHRGGVDRRRRGARVRARVLRLPALARSRRGAVAAACSTKRASGAPPRARSISRSAATTATPAPSAPRRRTPRRAGFERLIVVERRELTALPDAPAARGLVAVNPPYGERLGEQRELAAVYADLGRALRERYLGWAAAVLTGNPPLGRELGLKAKRTHTLFNGPIECRLLRFDIDAKHFETKREPGALPKFDEAAARARPGAAMFANRLRKNFKSLGSWARGAGVACFRVYDADMPEYAFSIDLYQDDAAAAADHPPAGSTCRSTRRPRRSTRRRRGRAARKRSR